MPSSWSWSILVDVLDYWPLRSQRDAALLPSAMLPLVRSVSRRNGVHVRADSTDGRRHLGHCRISPDCPEDGSQIQARRMRSTMPGVSRFAPSVLLAIINLSSLFWPALGLMVLGQRVSPGLHVLIVAPPATMSMHGSAVSFGTIWQAIWLRPVPCSGVGPCNAEVGDRYSRLRRRFTIECRPVWPGLSRLQ